MAVLPLGSQRGRWPWEACSLTIKLSAAIFHAMLADLVVRRQKSEHVQAFGPQMPCQRFWHGEVSLAPRRVRPIFAAPAMGCLGVCSVLASVCAGLSVGSTRLPGSGFMSIIYYTHFQGGDAHVKML